MSIILSNSIASNNAQVEVNVLSAITRETTSGHHDCAEMASKYVMNWTTFTETDYFETVQDMLSRLINVQGLCLRLPVPLIGRGSSAGKLIFANTLKAFATRPEEESANLTTLVLDKVTKQALADIFMNPMDLSYLYGIVRHLRHLVLILTLDEINAHVHGFLSRALSSTLADVANNLESFSVMGLERGNTAKPSLEVYHSEETEYRNFLTASVPIQALEAPCSVTKLELKLVTVTSKTIASFIELMPLEELYLSDVLLQTYQTQHVNASSHDVLWTGLPNQRQPEHGLWIAPYLRAALPKLRVCRASSLRYATLAPGESDVGITFDIKDPSGRARSIAQRFVEVVMGHKQPPAPDGHPIEYLAPEKYSKDETLADKPAMGRDSIVDYDTHAYQTAVGNSTSCWRTSLDGYFVNDSIASMADLKYIADTAYSGILELQQSHRSGTSSRQADYGHFAQLWNGRAL